MVGSFSVDPERLRQAGWQLELEARALAAALGRLEGRLASLGDVCGGDQPGRAFAAGYEPRAELVERALQSMVQGLKGVDHGLRQMADAYEGSDASSRVSGGAP